MTLREHAHHVLDSLPDPVLLEVLDFAELMKSKQLNAKKRSKHTFNDYIGALEDSPNLKDDPVKTQRKWRSEWR